MGRYILAAAGLAGLLGFAVSSLALGLYFTGPQALPPYGLAALMALSLGFSAGCFAGLHFLEETT